MKTREQLIEEHNRLLLAYEKVKDILSTYPNIVKIGIGLKERNGVLTDEGCIKIIVSKKVNADDLESSQLIPKEFDGIPTDIILAVEKTTLAICEEDQGHYRPIKGGIMINNTRNGEGIGNSGTLGCLAQLNADNSWVILSNHHVLYADSGQDGDEIGQPWVSCCWCCRGNVIAINSNKDLGLDCAIAKVNADINISNIIEEIGNIQGSGAVAAINGERVRKRGARTGLTSGTISFIDPVTKNVSITANPSGGPANNPGGCTNYVAGSTIFAFHGDSGSVIVNNNNEVVALLYSSTLNYLTAFANDILRVQTALGITIKTTSSTPGRTLSYSEAREDLATLDPPEKVDWLSAVETKLNQTHSGRSLLLMFQKHESELFNLVNKHRPVTLVWQRKQGPAFLAAFGRSVKYTDYKIPTEINKVSLQNLLMSMTLILEEHGSDVLKADIQKYASEIIHLSKNCHSAKAFFDILSDLDKKETIISSVN